MPVFQKPYSVKHKYLYLGVRLTKLTDEKRKMMIEKLEEAIKSLERLSISVREKAKKIEIVN